ncbi:hypothetical protein [Vibrio harveyi]|uniref:hypothetical protein n=1 Tax=Vibrio harveyi TaxID=669 RepID=UPI003CF8F6E1
MEIDVGSNSNEAGELLSNFSPFDFVFDDVHCASMEGLIQSFKFDCPERQKQICSFVGLKAKRKGQRRKWHLTKQLYWKGVSMDRHGPEYQQLLDRAFEALSENPAFQEALLSTGDATLVHHIGKSDGNFTILTSDEFCSRLMRLRDKLRNK